MNMGENTAGPGPAQAATLELGGRTVTIERVSQRKASVAFALLRGASGKVREVVHDWGRFQTEYEESHTVAIDRAMALLRYGPRPIVDDAGRPLVYPDRLEGPDGSSTPHPRAGQVVMSPSPLEAMTEEAWSAQGNMMRMPRSPSWAESAAAVLPAAIEHAEEEIYRLLALFTLSNEEVAVRRRDGTLRDELERRADELVDGCFADELVELAVVCGEVVDNAFRAKAAAIGGSRMGKALRLLGLNPARMPGPSEEAPQTGSQAPETTDSTSSSPHQRCVRHIIASASATT